MKSFRLFLAAFFAIMIVSCGVSKNQQYYGNQPYPNYGGYQQPVYQQQYQSQQGPDEAGFVEIKKSPIEELSLAVGTNEIRSYGTAEAGNEQMALNAARAQATAALQEKIEVYVRAGLDQYAQQTGVNSEYSLDESTRNQVMTAVKGIVNGATVLDTRVLYNPNTKRYKYEVCMKYDRAGVLNVMQQQSERILKNETQFEQDMQQAWDALDAQNNRMSLQEQQEIRKNQMEQENLDKQHERDMQEQQMNNYYNLEGQKVQAQTQQSQQQTQQTQQQNQQ